MTGTGSRRRFFRRFAAESLAWLEEIGGRPQYSLMDLWELPRNELGLLVPQICEGVRIEPEAEIIRIGVPGKEVEVTLSSTVGLDLAIFNLFNGVNSIGAIADRLGASGQLTPEENFDQVRSLFLRLVRCGVCVPCNAGPDGKAPDVDVKAESDPNSDREP